MFAKYVSELKSDETAGQTKMST